MPRALPVVVVLCVAAAVATAGSRSQLANVSGVYTSNWEDVTLQQDGSRVRGTYVCCGGGTIEGRIVEGRVIKFHWHEPRGAGHGGGVWVIKNDGKLEGTWGHGQSETDGGPWTLAPKSSGQIAN